jgi:FkbM family methyltransferase
MIVPDQPAIGRISNSFALSVAVFGFRYLPRGKAAFARKIGALLLGDRLVTSPTDYGYNLVCPGSALDMAAFLRVGKNWDNHVLDCCLANLGEDGIFYDVGANLGYMALSVAKKRGGNVKVFAFEPNPDLARSIATAASVNNLAVRVLPLAISDVSGDVSFFVPRHTIHASLKSRQAGATVLNVRAATLDDLVASGFPAPTVMKIDVEGAEFELFKGACKTLRQYKPALVYECDNNLDRFGHSREEVESLLKSFGYLNIRRLRKTSGDWSDDYIATA